MSATGCYISSKPESPVVKHRVNVNGLSIYCNTNRQPENEWRTGRTSRGSEPKVYNTVTKTQDKMAPSPRRSSRENVHAPGVCTRPGSSQATFGPNSHSLERPMSAVVRLHPRFSATPWAQMPQAQRRVLAAQAQKALPLTQLTQGDCNRFAIYPVWPWGFAASEDPGCLVYCLFTSLSLLASHWAHTCRSQNGRTYFFNHHSAECISRTLWLREQRSGSLWSGSVGSVSADERTSRPQRPTPAPATPRGWRFPEAFLAPRRAAPRLSEWLFAASYFHHLTAMINASRAAASRLIGAAASRGPTVARHQVRSCRALPEGSRLMVLDLGAAGSAPFGVRILWGRSGGKEDNGHSVIIATSSSPISGFCLRVSGLAESHPLPARSLISRSGR